MIADHLSAQTQIDRILVSETFKASPVLRSLLEFLGKKFLSGQGDEIKEYTIAVDGLGKHHSYDPQRDSGVRIQVGRLRLKLAEYYRSEGTSDPMLLEVPKGHFSLRCEVRLPSLENTEPLRIEPRVEQIEEPARIAAPFPSRAPEIWGLAKSRSNVVMLSLLLASLLWTAVVTVHLSHELSVKAAQTSWTPDIEQLWLPFVNPQRPVLISIAAPLFIGIQGEGVYRDLSLDRWSDVLKSQKVKAIQTALGGKSDLVPRYYYTGFGDAEAAFELGKLLGPRQNGLSMARSDELSWQQLADNDVVSIGPPRFFDQQLRGLASELAFTMNSDGITNLRPRPGEPTILRDRYPSIKEIQDPNGSDEGELYVLITNTPGPLGKGNVRSFTSNHNPGAFAAMQWFTKPEFANILVSNLKTASGALPHSFQVVLDVQYKDSVPTQVSYVMQRELHTPSVAPRKTP